jgi:hypothetical protein
MPISAKPNSAGTPATNPNTNDTLPATTQIAKNRQPTTCPESCFICNLYTLIKLKR